MENLLKQFLDYEGLAIYDELIKEYIDSKNDQGGAALQQLSETVEQAKADIVANTQAIEANTGAIEVLNGDKNTAGSILNTVDNVVGAKTQEAVEAAISNLVDGAPETLDTLKEVADWIAADETGTAALISRVSNAEDAIEENQESISNLAQSTTSAINNLKSYVDSQDRSYYNSIGAINEAKIQMLFKDKVEVEEGQTVADAIASLTSDQVLVLDSDVTEDLTIPANTYIDANGATLSGNIVIDESSVIVNAVFTGTVTVG